MLAYVYYIKYIELVSGYSYMHVVNSYHLTSGFFDPPIHLAGETINNAHVAVKSCVIIIVSVSSCMVIVSHQRFNIANTDN